MQTNFLTVALTNLSLFNRSNSTTELLRAINNVTGIPMGELLHAERRMLRTGSLTPVRELLVNPGIPRAERFKYKIGLKQIHKGKKTQREQVASRFVLEISTVRGRLDIEVMMVVKRNLEPSSQGLQTAQIQINYTTHLGNTVRTHTQKLNITDTVPVAWDEQTRPVTMAACAA